MGLIKELRLALAAWLDDRLPALSLLIALLFLPNYTVFELESGIYDVYTKIRALRYMERSHPADPIEPGIVVVLVDDEAIRRDPRFLSDSPYPLPRHYLAKLLERICEAKPRTVALDVLLDFAASKEQDDLLSRAFAQAYVQQCSIVLSAKLANAGGRLQPVLPMKDFLSLDAVRHRKLLVGNINVESSQASRVVRRVRAGQALRLGSMANTYILQTKSEIEYDYLSSNGRYSLSLPMQMLRMQYPVLQGNANSEVDHLLKNGPFLIDFASMPGNVSIISSWEILAGKRLEMLLDKMIILGVAYSGSSDWHMAPLSTTSLFFNGFTAMGPVRQAYPGSELLAYMYLTLDSVYTNREYIKEINHWALMLMAMAAFGMIQGGMFLIGKPDIAGRLIFALLCSYWIISVVTFQVSGLYLAVLRPGAAVIALLLLARYLKKISKVKE